MGEEGVEVWRQQCLNVIEHVGARSMYHLRAQHLLNHLPTLYNVSGGDHAL